MSAEHPRVAILASGDIKTGGGGSTLERVARDVQELNVSFTIGVVVCNNPEGSVGVYPKIDRVNKDYALTGEDKIDVVHIGPDTHPGHPLKRGQTLDESEAISNLMEDRGIDFIWMLGYMRILTGKLVKDWAWKPEHALKPGFEYRNGLYHPSARIANNHPAILPFTADTHGLGAHAKAVRLAREGKLSHSAMTWHLASNKIDDGPVIAEVPVEIQPHYDAADLGDMVQFHEKQMTTQIIDTHLRLRAQHIRGN